MEYLKVNFPRGLALRNNDLESEIGRAKKATNLWYSTDRKLRKRPGFKEDTEFRTRAEAASSADNSFVGITRFQNRTVDLTGVDPQSIVKYKEEVVVLSRDYDSDSRSLLTIYDGTDYKTLPAQYTQSGLFPGQTYKPQFLPLRNVLFWNEADGIYKYDGLIHHKAGLPVPDGEITTTAGSASTNRRYKYFYATVDHQDNVILSDVKTSAIINLTAFNLRINANEDFDGVMLSKQGYDNKYFAKTTGATISPALYNGVLCYAVSGWVGNISVGDYVTKYVYTGSRISDASLKLKVFDINSGVVYFSIPDSFIWVPNPVRKWIPLDSISPIPNLSISSTEVFSNVMIGVYQAVSPYTDYTLVGYYPVRQGTVTIMPMFTTSQVNAFVTTSQATDLLSFTLDTVARRSSGELFPGLEAASGVYKLAVYNDLMLIALEEEILYSNTFNVGGSVEDFSSVNVLFAGTSADGPIKAIFANEEYILVMRERESYYISGNITTGNIRIQPVNETLIGSVGPTAVGKLFGQGVVISPKGVYMSGGGAVLKEMSSDVESIFLDPNNLLPQASWEVDYRRDTAFCIFTDNLGVLKMLVFNYKYKEWTFWRLPLQSTKSVNIGDMTEVFGKLFIIRGNRVYVEDTSADFNDQWGDDVTPATKANIPVAVEYETLPITYQNPQVEKKLHEIVLYGMGARTPMSVVLRGRADWTNTNFMNETYALLAANNYYLKKKCTPVKANAIVVNLSDNTDGDFVVHGFDLGVEISQVENRRSF